METLDTQVLIIGGGATGTGLARDLALRGVTCLLVERGDVNAGASGANHGLLHSGARYVASDPEAARECRRESELLKRLAPQCIENTGGMFVAVAGDDEQYAAAFPERCRDCGIACQPIDAKAAREIEPGLSERAAAAYLVEDATIDPFRLSLENIAQAMDRGTRLLLHTRVVAMEKGAGRIAAVLLETRSGNRLRVNAEVVVNAAGAWAGEIAALADIPIAILYSKGSLLITEKRLTQRVINRLRPAADADILVPGGTVSILGTTSIRLASLDSIRPTVGEIDRIVDTAAAMVPALQTTRYIRAYAGVRPLVGSQRLDDDRAVSRGYALLDHEAEGAANFVTITGGKLTTYRLMAERTGDLVCRKLGIDKACRTRSAPLPATNASQWTVAGLAPRVWLQEHNRDDTLLCECEMVPKSTIDEVIREIYQQNGTVSLSAINLRSRIGKGTCQGAFCSLRISAYMYERGHLTAEKGTEDLKVFLNKRWKGIRPVLWGGAMVQEELQEALHCGLFGMELEGAP